MHDSASYLFADFAGPAVGGTQTAMLAQFSRVTVNPPPIPLELLASVQGSAQQTAPDEADLERALLGAPPWLISSMIHMSLLIMLGISFSNSLEPAIQVEIKTINENADDGLIEGSGDLGIDSPDVASGVTEFSPLDLPPVDSPLAAPLTVAELSPHGKFLGSLTSHGDAPIGLALSGREKGMKRVLGRKFGGTAGTRAAVVKGLEWFKRNQRSDGAWSLKGPYADGAYEEDQPAATAMALLAFQGDGHTHQSGEYKEQVRKGWSALIKMQSANGQFLHNGLSVQHQLYAHAQCTMAICELYAMTQDSAFRRPAELAVEFCVKSQDPTLGGWRYQVGIDSDLSVTGWFLMALHTARMASLEVPEDVLRKASEFLDKVQSSEGSQYAYLAGGHPTPAMTAEGLLSRQYLGWKRNDARLVAGANSLLSLPIKMDSSERDVYYWYYATQMLHHMEGKYWQEWNKAMSIEVPRAQVKEGREAGSWDPGAYKYGLEGGRLFVTALQTYMLESYYRHMPLYSDRESAYQ